tara:strand:- start:856 stop:2388 length:1533 start_codon:yes stop_codon:yes gene_type:complete
MMKDELQNICDERIFDKKYMIKLSLNKELRNRITIATEWIVDKLIPFKMRCVAIHKELTSENFPICQVCKNNQVTYDKAYMKHFLDVCSSACARKLEHRLESETYRRLSDFDWMYEQRITKCRSFEDIAVLLNCSTIPVVKACKQLKIPEVKHNESNSIVMGKLRDKTWLHQKHVVERVKLRDLADEIGTSLATVQRWLVFHNIIANPSNSYDRDFNKTSLEEDELFEFIRTILPNESIKRSDRRILEGSELDIFIPSKRIAIEYNGIYSHLFRPEESREAIRKGEKYHLNKSKKCEAKDIRLIHIFSDDWMNRKEIWKSILCSVFNVIDFTFYARKLKIKEVEKSDKNLFLRDNHLQGNDNSSIAFGLYEGDELIAIMTFLKSRYNKNFEWELSRFCVRKNTKCVGGFSRLLKHFTKKFEGNVVSYADYSRSNGDVYRKNGFVLLKQNKPSYAYVNLSKHGIQRKHRSNFTKKKIGASTNVTEYDFMESQGYRKIFDCGTLVFVKYSNN